MGIIIHPPQWEDLLPQPMEPMANPVVRDAVVDLITAISEETQTPSGIINVMIPRRMPAFLQPHWHEITHLGRRAYVLCYGEAPTPEDIVF